MISINNEKLRTGRAFKNPWMSCNLLLNYYKKAHWKLLHKEIRKNSIQIQINSDDTLLRSQRKKVKNNKLWCADIAFYKLCNMLYYLWNLIYIKVYISAKWFIEICIVLSMYIMYTSFCKNHNLCKFALTYRDKNLTLTYFETLSYITEAIFKRKTIQLANRIV